MTLREVAGKETVSGGFTVMDISARFLRLMPSFIGSLLVEDLVVG